MNIRSFLVFVCLWACGSPSTEPPPLDSAGVVDRTSFVEACTAFNHPCTAMNGADCGKCQYRFKLDATRCSDAAPCDNVVLLWSNFGCDADGVDAMFDAVLAREGYIAACAQPLYPGELLPASIGAPERENAVVAELFAAIGGAWSGANILHVGCSMGASRYPVVAARYPDDASWNGTRKSAACMSDGVISIVDQDRFVGEAVGTGGMSCAGRHSRIVRAYTNAAPAAGHACTGSPNGQCACDAGHASLMYPGDCGDGDCVAFDSIVQRAGAGFAFAPGVTAGSFAVRHWKILGEGSAFRDTAMRCERDVVDAAPMQGLCSALDADPDRTCTFVDLPNAPHCATFSQSFAPTCLDWFDALP
jgi:hypothetical protein